VEELTLGLLRSTAVGELGRCRVGARRHRVGLSPRASSEVLGCFHARRKVL